MHTLETEFRELHAARAIDEATATRLIALDTGTLLSVFEELRFTLYASVAALTTGLGLLLKSNLERIGPMTVIVALACIAATCYATAVRTARRHATRSIGGDYVLLLGALLASATVAYAESQYHWLGASWSRYVLILVVFHAVTAYVFTSRLLLTVALTGLIGWLGIEPGFGSLLELHDVLAPAGARALVGAFVVFVWRELHRRCRGDSSLQDVLEQYAVNLAFVGALTWCWTRDRLALGAVILAGVTLATVRVGLATGREILIVYGVVYGAAGACILEARFIGGALPSATLALVTVIGASILLSRLHRQLKDRID